MSIQGHGAEGVACRCEGRGIPVSFWVARALPFPWEKSSSYPCGSATFCWHMVTEEWRRKDAIYDTQEEMQRFGRMNVGNNVRLLNTRWRETFSCCTVAHAVSVVRIFVKWDAKYTGWSSKQASPWTCASVCDEYEFVSSFSLHRHEPYSRRYPLSTSRKSLETLEAWDQLL